MKRAVFIFAVLVIAFSAMGAGFSSYSDSVVIDATAKTGTVALGIASRNVLSDGSQLFPDRQTGATQQSDLAAAEPTGTITTTNGHLQGSISGISYSDGLTINAYNCQSGFSPGLQLEIANVGTLPARLSEFSFDWGYPADIVNWSFTGPDDGVLTRGTDAQSLQEALKQVVIKPQERLDLAVRLQFTSDVDEGACAVTMRYNRWNVDTP